MSITKVHMLQRLQVNLRPTNSLMAVCQTVQMTQRRKSTVLIW